MHVGGRAARAQCVGGRAARATTYLSNGCRPCCEAPRVRQQSMFCMRSDESSMMESPGEYDYSKDGQSAPEHAAARCCRAGMPFEICSLRGGAHAPPTAPCGARTRSPRWGAAQLRFRHVCQPHWLCLGGIPPLPTHCTADKLLSQHARRRSMGVQSWRVPLRVYRPPARAFGAQQSCVTACLVSPGGCLPWPQSAHCVTVASGRIPTWTARLVARAPAAAGLAQAHDS